MSLYSTQSLFFSPHYSCLHFRTASSFLSILLALLL
jgi:hypothetical protein